MKKIIIYTTSFCPFCVRAKDLFDSLGLAYDEVNISVNHKLREELIQKHNWMTVPAIFFGEDLIGGFDQVNELHRNGELMERLG